MPKKKTESVAAKEEKYPPPRDFQKNAHVKSFAEYSRLYKRSVEDPEGFWAERAKELSWFKKWERVLDYDFRQAKIRWFEGGKMNVSFNCLDRHLETWRKNKAALIWVGDRAGEYKIYTYQLLHREVCKFATVLKGHGVKKGDRVAIYLPMVPELPIAMLACARMGVIHSVVFGGYSAASLSNRMKDCGARMLITADGGFRGGRVIPLKREADEALTECPEVKTCIVVRRAGTSVQMKEGRDCWWDEEMSGVDLRPEYDFAVMDAEDPLFILYTSGSTGKPKGVLHTTAGYLLFAYQTFQWIFDIRDEDTFWCTADIGWITGHSYCVYGPLCSGATSLIFEGVPTHPDPGRCWQIVQDYKVNIFYTAPTVIRALAKHGDEWPNRHDLSSLRLLGSVGEIINPEAWKWYHKHIGQGRCPIVDTWWQTETGGNLIAPLPGAIPTKPGSVTVPFPGVVPQIVNDKGEKCKLNEAGYLVITKPWPGIMRGVYKEPERFRRTYFSQFPGMYFTGDGAKKDEDGYYWITGRVDDVINVSGHRMGTAEVESAFVSHEDVAEAAIVGYPHDIKGEGIYAFVTLNTGVEGSDDLRKALIDHVRKEIGPIATPDKIQFTDTLPKTRSGKIMRRILRKIAAGDVEDMGDLSTLADRAGVTGLIEERQI
ncbi:MAG: acetate--CoA ligase [Deltaproteobacteria bacterium]|nr:acetate--CoA ligase [Deltaproteobacteria bacterium]